jgi:hypothetical protein
MNQFLPQPFIYSDDYWEKMWSPYPEETYREVLENVHPWDTVLEIGAGDLRLARRIAGKCARVYAIEIQRTLVKEAIGSLYPMPPNLVIIDGDACKLPFLPNITLAVLLMRHCTKFRHYAEKLRGIGCSRLITNARWRTGIEVISLHGQRENYFDFPLGWYACWCGEVGFKPGPVEELTYEVENLIHEVKVCPRCNKNWKSSV